MSIDAPAKIGIGPDDLLKRNPRLIYAHSSGWEERAGCAS
jgi:crotonobetainyl-CoA:carnitine CoA-transferase CaiB-like acyl-CoA transferase